MALKDVHHVRPVTTPDGGGNGTGSLFLNVDPGLPNPRKPKIWGGGVFTGLTFVGFHGNPLQR